MTPNNFSRLESPDYGKHTLSSLKRIADALDVALVVRFVPFSQYINWLSGTPQVDEGLKAKKRQPFLAKKLQKYGALRLRKPYLFPNRTTISRL